MVILTAHQSSPAPLQCRERPRDHLHQMWSTYSTSLGIHESSFAVKEMPGNFSRHPYPQSSPLSSGLNSCNPGNHVTQRVHQRSHCAWWVHQHSTQDTMFNTLSIRSYALSYDPDRYPNLLVEAVRPSDCVYCLGDGICEAMTYPVIILRKTGQCDAAGFYEYVGGWLRLTVGFTCAVRPEVIAF